MKFNIGSIGMVDVAQVLSDIQMLFPFLNLG